MLRHSKAILNIHFLTFLLIIRTMLTWGFHKFLRCFWSQLSKGVAPYCSLVCPYRCVHPQSAEIWPWTYKCFPKYFLQFFVPFLIPIMSMFWLCKELFRRNFREVQRLFAGSLYKCACSFCESSLYLPLCASDKEEVLHWYGEGGKFVCTLCVSPHAYVCMVPCEREGGGVNHGSIMILQLP
jgi:hypothetical protein